MRIKYLLFFVGIALLIISALFIPGVNQHARIPSALAGIYTPTTVPQP